MNCDTYDCTDAGTENCPCYLAVTGDCLTCTRLQGKDYCDCNWKGVCIYNEFMQGSGKINNPRKELSAPIVSRKMYLDDLAVFALDVGRGFAIKSSRPGSFIFIRSRKDNRFYDLPISVMKADVEKGLIYVTVKIIAMKTKSLMEEEESFIIRGVYRNGILGIRKWMEKAGKSGSVLLITKGVGIAPAILIRENIKAVVKVDIMADSEKISTELLEDYLSGQEGTLQYVTLSDPRHRELMEDAMEKAGYGAVAILTSDYYIELLSDGVRRVLPEAAIAVGNNYHLCCGEGICGSCAAVDQNGQELKMCKCQNLHP